MVPTKQLSCHKMNEKSAVEILRWNYERPYDFYNNEVTFEALKELLDGSYYTVVDQQEGLAGFFCIGKSAQVPAGHLVGAYTVEYIDFGLGMRPDLTGQGFGYDFCMFILEFVQEMYQAGPTRLTVAKFNKRAIRLYEKLGFKKHMEFGTPYSDFLVMVRELQSQM